MNIPDMWRLAIIKPIPKSGQNSKYEPLGYRGISLLSCIGKIYSAILNERLVSYLENLSIIADEQNGFRKNRSCDDHVFVLHSVITNRLNAGLCTYVAFVDLAKVFDSVNRELLFYKLLINGIDGKFYYAIKALYSNTKNCIKLNELN